MNRKISFNPLAGCVVTLIVGSVGVAIANPVIEQQSSAKNSVLIVTGSGGCNRFNGGFKTKGNQLTINPLATTRKACEESLMTQESRFLKALQTAQRYEVNDQGLQIFYKTDQGSGVLRFTSQNVRGLW